MAIVQSSIMGSILNNNPVCGARNGYLFFSGIHNGIQSSISIDEDILSKHMLLIGATGCGKSNTFYFIVDQLKEKMTANDVMIVFDTKGDYYKLFGSTSDAIIANSDPYYTDSERWNIFREILSDGWDKRKIESNLQEISWAIFKEAIERSKDPFFPNAARDLFAACLRCIMLAGEENQAYKTENFFNSELKRAMEESSVQDIRELLQSQPDCAAVSSYLGDGDSAQAMGVYSELLSTFSKVFTGVFAEKGAFSIRNFVRQKGGRTLFIEYDLAIGNTLSPMYSLLIDLALKESLGRLHKEGNVYMICDEFRLLPYLQHIDDGVNFGRSLGVKIIAGLQSINQLTEVYHEARGQNIAAGFSTSIAFRANDRATREYVSGLYGKNYIKEEYKTLTNSIKEDRRQSNVVEDWDMNDLHVGEAVIGLPFSQPFRFQFDRFNR